ncbi:glycosyltransferase family 4 protein [Candidatus Sumerlaeota bacterium]|nr:glycosyltransferase family 4 protein [Candidatus Sumerlaeota bacterium]
MLTIGYDASVTLAPSPRGIARYALELLRALLALPRTDLRFVVLLNSLRHEAGPQHNFLLDDPRVSLVRRNLPGPVVVHGWRLARRPTWEQLAGRTCDVVHGPANYIPPSRSPVVVTVHDLGFLRDDEAQLAPLAGKYFRAAFPRQLPHVARIITPSRFVADEVAGTYHIDRQNIDAIHSGINGDLFSPQGGMRTDQLAALGITRRFVLAITAHQPRKRADWIAKVAASCARTDVQFVTVGMPEGLSDSRLVSLRDVDDGTLAALYASASAVLLTTREEGFGFPVLEALASGTPVICGRNSSLAEIGGGCASYADEDTPEGFAKALGSVLDHPPHEAQRAAWIEHARQFTWRSCAEQVARCYERVAVPRN